MVFKNLKASTAKKMFYMFFYFWQVNFMFTVLPIYFAVQLFQLVNQHVLLLLTCVLLACFSSHYSRSGWFLRSYSRDLRTFVSCCCVIFYKPDALRVIQPTFKLLKDYKLTCHAFYFHSFLCFHFSLIQWTVQIMADFKKNFYNEPKTYRKTAVCSAVIAGWSVK